MPAAGAARKRKRAPAPGLLDFFVRSAETTGKQNRPLVLRPLGLDGLGMDYRAALGEPVNLSSHLGTGAS